MERVYVVFMPTPAQIETIRVNVSIKSDLYEASLALAEELDLPGGFSELVQRVLANAQMLKPRTVALMPRKLSAVKRS